MIRHLLCSHQGTVEFPWHHKYVSEVVQSEGRSCRAACRMQFTLPLRASAQVYHVTTCVEMPSSARASVDDEQCGERKELQTIVDDVARSMSRGWEVTCRGWEVTCRGWLVT